MRLVGTRDEKESVEFSQALLSPSANFGGLYAPKILPKFSKEFFIKATNLSYTNIALEVIKSFEFDVELEVFKQALKSYEKFDNPNCPIEIKKIDENLYINELFHGPTRAFKDMALQPFGVLIDALAKQRDEKYLIMCATSGDTGPATLKAFENSENVKVVCLYPASGTSEVQRLQMTNIKGQNLKSIGIKGNFDDAQKALKTLLVSDDFNDSLKENGLKLSAANSVNFGRILFQIVYHIYAYIHLLKTSRLKDDESFDIVVPSGNFGNALGAYYAKKMGAKINDILIVSNQNNVLTELFNSGVYDIKDKSLVKTISPAMDILVSSNVERLLFSEFGDKKTKLLMENLAQDKFYQIPKIDGFKAKFCTDSECINFIKEMALKNILIDPHTATTFKFNPVKRPTVLTSTAHWVKFTPSMLEAIKGIKTTNEKEQMILLANEFNDSVPKEILDLFENEQIHKDIVEISDIKKTILDWIER